MNMKKKSWKSIRPALFFGLEPEVLGGDGQTLVLAERQAALVAMRALQAGTRREFAQAAGRTMESLLEDWGDEIEEAYGSVPAADEPITFQDYWGAWCFADLIADPRQAAFDTVTQWRDLKQVFEDAGFVLHYGFPGFPGIEEISVTDPAQAERVAAATGLDIAADENLMRSSLPS